MIGVYRIKNLKNNDCYYGSSKEIEKRFKRHLNELKKDKINFIIFNMEEFMRLQKDYKRMSKYELKKFSSLIKTLNPIFRKNNLFVFKII